MALYIYKARDKRGDLLEGTIEASGLEQGVSKLQQLGLYTVEIKKSAISINFMLKQTLELAQLANFCKQLATLLKAGVPLLGALQILWDYQEQPRTKKLIKSLMNEVELGFSFSEACANYAQEIPNIMVNIISSGEIGGFLDHSLENLAQYFEKELDIKTRVINAVSYSLIVLLASLFFLFFLFTFVVPNFLVILKDMDVLLTPSTEGFLNLGILLFSHWYYALMVIILSWTFIRWASFTKGGKGLQDKILLGIPVVKGLITKILLGRFCRELSNLLKSGIPIFRALEILEQASENSLLKSDLNRAYHNLKMGHSISESFQNSQLVSKMVIQMIAVGEQSGKLEEMLAKAGGFYDYEVNQLTTRLPKIIEPLVLVVVGVIIGAIILGLLLPMLNAMYQIGF